MRKEDFSHAFRTSTTKSFFHFLISHRGSRTSVPTNVISQSYRKVIKADPRIPFRGATMSTTNHATTTTSYRDQRTLKVRVGSRDWINDSYRDDRNKHKKYRTNYNESVISTLCTHARNYLFFFARRVGRLKSFFNFFFTLLLTIRVRKVLHRQVVRSGRHVHM